MITRKPAFNIVLVSALAGAACAAEKEIQLSEVPAPVKATIDQKTAGATIEEVEVEDKDGRQVYSVEFKRDGKEVEIEIAADGSYLGEETDNDDAKTTAAAAKADDEEDDEQAIDLASAPEAVRSALTPLLAGATLKRLTKETEDGQVLYEADYTADGKERSVELTAAGAMVEQEEVLPVEEIPEAVSNAVRKLHPAGMIKKVESVTKKAGAEEARYFEIDVLSKGKVHEVEVDPTGKVLENDEADND